MEHTTKYAKMRVCIGSYGCRVSGFKTIACVMVDPSIVTNTWPLRGGKQLLVASDITTKRQAEALATFLEKSAKMIRDAGVGQVHKEEYGSRK